MTGGSRIEGFERSVVFRIARGYFVFMAVLSVLAIAGGAIIAMYGFIPRHIEEPQPLPPVPPPKVISLADVNQWIADQERTQAASPTSLYDESKAAPRSEGKAEIDRIEKLADQLKLLFPEPTYSWDDVIQNYCKVPTSFGCLQRGQRTVKEGVVRIVKSAVTGMRRAEVIPMLELLISVISEAPLERRGGLILPTVSTYKALNTAWQQQVEERDRRAETERRDFEKRRAELEAGQDFMKRYGAYAAILGLGLLILMSVFLAHFAIERHLRLLQAMTDQRRAAG